MFIPFQGFLTDDEMFLLANSKFPSTIELTTKNSST